MIIHVAIVEDDEEIRANLTHRIGETAAFHILGSYPDAESALSDLPRHKPDVVLMDINLPGLDGIECVRLPPAKLMAAIREANAGGAPMTPQIARRVVQHFQSVCEPPNDMPRLTPRETDVLNQLAKGFRYKEIIDNLGISAGTLHSYISSTYEKLHVHSRTEAVVKYLNR